MLNPAEIGALIEKYQNEKYISIDQHVKRRSLELSAEMQGKLKVYLDQRFWLILRDVVLDRSDESGAKELLAELKQAVGNGSAICPISESLLLELLKQDDPETRQATANLVDSLSCGVTLVHADQRVAQEIVGVFTKFSEPELYHEPHELIWAKLGHTLGVFHPDVPEVPEDQQVPLQKAFFDIVWEMPLTELLSLVQMPYPSVAQDYEEMARRINSLNRDHAEALKSYRQAYLDEFRGVLGAHIRVARIYLEVAFERKSGEKVVRSEQEQHEEEGRLLNFFGNVIAKKAGSLLMPTLHISSICYAAVRWDKKRRITGNDLFDFQHAQAAVAYCEAFFTERPLQTLLHQRRREWEADFPCAVFSDLLEAREWLVSAVGG